MSFYAVCPGCRLPVGRCVCKLKEEARSQPTPPADSSEGEDWFNISFMDCWAFDEKIPEDGRWLAVLNKIASVAAPTREQAFEEMIISIRSLLAYKAGIQSLAPVSTEGVEEAAKAHALETYGDHEDYEMVRAGTVLDFKAGATWQSSQQTEGCRWVDVNDRLPEFILHDKTTSEKVIILFDGFITIGSLYKKFGEEQNVWFTMDDTFDEQFHLNVTHWMPLPSSPSQSSLPQTGHEAVALLVKTRDRLYEFLDDEDLTEQKLQDASEGLFPNLADEINIFIHKNKLV